MTNRGSLQNSYISVRPKKMLTEKGIKSCINRPNTHWKGNQSSKEELFWKAKDPIIFQWLSSSVERSERDNQLQDTIPQHCGESIWIQQSEWVLLQICSGHLSTQPLTPPATPLSPHMQYRSAKTRCARSSRSRRGRKHQAQTVSHQPVWNSVLTSWSPSSQRSSTDHWNCAKSLHASNTPPSSPSQRNPKSQDQMTTGLWLLCL